MTHDALKTLHTSLVDAIAGYDKAIAEAESPALSNFLATMRELHQNAHRDIHAALSTAGERPDDDGSLMGTVHKAAIAVRSAVTGIDEGSLSAFASGEENIVERYDAAIADEAPEVAAMLQGHRARLTAKISEMRAMAD